MRLVVAIAAVLIAIASVAAFAATTSASRPSTREGARGTGGPTAIATSPLTGGTDVIATVDDMQVTRDAFDIYAGAFVDPTGALSVDRTKILEAVITQALVDREAKRLGLS